MDLLGQRFITCQHIFVNFNKLIELKKKEAEEHKKAQSKMKSNKVRMR
jgi:hypothetical protein